MPWSKAKSQTNYRQVFCIESKPSGNLEILEHNSPYIVTWDIKLTSGITSVHGGFHDSICDVLLNWISTGGALTSVKSSVKIFIHILYTCNTLTYLIINRLFTLDSETLWTRKRYLSPNIWRPGNERLYYKYSLKKDLGPSITEMSYCLHENTRNWGTFNPCNTTMEQDHYTMHYSK